MGEWSPCPYAGNFAFLDAAQVRQLWPRLHAGDAEPLPADPAVLQAWVLLHGGALAAARAAGLACGPAGLDVVHKATAIYAVYVEPGEARRLELLREIAASAQMQAAASPDHASAWYWQAWALARYSQGISVAKALAQGLGTSIQQGLQRCIALSPGHADAHIALGSFHAEVIDKVGPLIGSMTYGARKDIGLRMLERGLQLHPASVTGMVEYARALLMLDGERRLDQANHWYERAAATVPLDAVEQLEVDQAQAALAD